MSISLKSLVAGTALFGSASAMALGLVTLVDQPSSLTVAYLGGGAVAFKLALRALLPKAYRPDLPPPPDPRIAPRKGASSPRAEPRVDPASAPIGASAREEVPR